MTKDTISFEIELRDANYVDYFFLGTTTVGSDERRDSHYLKNGMLRTKMLLCKLFITQILRS